MHLLLPFFVSTVANLLVNSSTSATSTKSPMNAAEVSLPLMTIDDLHYAVNVSVGTKATQKFALTIDLKEISTTLADVSLEPRQGRGYALLNASNIMENDTGYYEVNDYMQVRLRLVKAVNHFSGVYKRGNWAGASCIKRTLPSPMFSDAENVPLSFPWVDFSQYRTSVILNGSK